MEDVRQFLQTVVTADEDGWLCLACARLEAKQWREHWYKWPSQLDDAVGMAYQQAIDRDIYFSSYLFSEHSSAKSAVIPGRTIQADLDEADVLSLPMPPTVLVETS